MPMALAMILTTYPDMGAAQDAARGVVSARLAACANMAQINSVYRWEGKVREGGEVIVIFKTTGELVPRLREKLLADHPYDVPECVELDARSSGPYMDWVTESVDPKAQ